MASKEKLEYCWMSLSIFTINWHSNSTWNQAVESHCNHLGVYSRAGYFYWVRKYRSMLRGQSTFTTNLPEGLWLMLTSHQKLPFRFMRPLPPPHLNCLRLYLIPRVSTSLPYSWIYTPNNYGQSWSQTLPLPPRCFVIRLHEIPQVSIWLPWFL